MPFVSIDIEKEEWDQAFSVLLELGLKFAAVTSPLKVQAGARAGLEGPANTLWIEKGAIRGANTDVLALQSLAEEFSAHKKIWMWGAGAMSASVSQAFPAVKVIGAREGYTGEGDSPDLLIWATGRSREFKWPPNLPGLKAVLDLNYGDDSPGLELAATRNFSYQSGLRLFKLQAEFQRQIWREHLESL